MNVLFEGLPKIAQANFEKSSLTTEESLEAPSLSTCLSR
jgi:hypothetical protein